MPFVGNRTIYANFNLKGLQDPESNYYNYNETPFNILNNISETINLRVDNSYNPFSLSFSVNGVDGIGFTDNTFNLNKFYFENQKIYFIAKIKSNSNEPLKYFPKIKQGRSKNQISLSAINGNGNLVNATFHTNHNIDSEAGGYFKGFAIFDKPYDNIKIKGEVSTIYTDSIDYKTNARNGILSGETTSFDIYPKKGKNVYRKINEDNDQKENYKKLIFQNILAEKNSFFDNFLGSIVGDISGSPNNLGTKIYEKISNLPSNNTDLNYSNVRSLISMLESTDIDIEKYFINIPPSLQRVVDNLSVPASLQLGAVNNFNENFDNKGYENSKIYGTNKGAELDFNTTLLEFGEGSTKIIAYEKFSENYTILDTNLLSTNDFRYNQGNTNTYSLSDYDRSWGWNLIVPNDIFDNKNFIILEKNTVDTKGNTLSAGLFTLQNNLHRLLDQKFDSIKGDPNTIKNFYKFYEYKDGIEGTFQQQFIDYSNPATEIEAITSFGQFNDSGGLIDQLVMQNMYSGLSLLSS
jgi:hypothetical protein